jgi:hypothetical protein
MSDGFAAWQRIASENLIQATSGTDQDRSHALQLAITNGKRAKQKATNPCENMLALGLIHTAETLLVFLEGMQDG